MERDAIILYLRDVIDLEISKRKILDLQSKSKAYYKQQTQIIIKNTTPATKSINSDDRLFIKYCKPHYTDNTKKRALIFISVITISVMLVAASLSSFSADTNTILFLTLFGTMLIAFLFYYLFLFLPKSDREEYEHAMDNYLKQCAEYTREAQDIKKYNTAVISNAKRQRENELSALQNESEKMNNYYTAEYNKVASLLDSYYSMNIIPNQYRNNLSAIYYIYDWMSSTQDSLRDTLFHSHIEDGIQRIERQMGRLLTQLEQAVYETRCVSTKAQSLIDQNNAMLHSLEQNEQNTAEAAQYAALASNYSKANAYFSLATYLKS